MQSMATLQRFLGPLLFMVLTIQTITTHAAIPPTENYVHTASFGSDDVKLYWKVNETHIVFEVHGKTTGWVGIGFSPNSGMKGSDIFVGWVKNGHATVTDRHGLDNAFPPKDPQQNLVVLAGTESEGWTMFKFSRQLAKCEEIYDREITADTQRVIYAWNDEDPTGSDITPENKHSSFHRGSKSIYFMQDPKSPTSLPEGPTYQTIDILAGDITVPTEGTYYGCKLFKLPDFGKKYHVVKAEPIIQTGNEAIVHHILIYRCGDHIQNVSEVGISAECRTPNMQHFSTCQTTVIAWAVGGSPLYYPPEAGYSIGGKGDPVYIQLEIHYDNPTLLSGISDNSGLRLTYTDTLRKYDVGVFVQGVSTLAPNYIVPPRQGRYQVTGHCRPDCLDMVMTNAGVDNVTVFGVFMHAHLAARAIRVRHFRNGQELPYLVRDEAYDFNYQEYLFLEEPRIFTTKDSLMTECVYNTLDRENITTGGFGSYEEMCLSFMLYYPKIDVSTCTTATSFYNAWLKIGIDTSLLRFDAEKESNPNLHEMYYKNQTMYDYFNQIDWTPEMTEKFNAANNHVFYQICIPQNDSNEVTSQHEVEKIEFPYVPPQVQCLDLKPPPTDETPKETTSDGTLVSLDLACILSLVAISIALQ